MGKPVKSIVSKVNCKYDSILIYLICLFQGENTSSFVEKILQLEREGNFLPFAAQETFENGVYAATNALNSANGRMETLQKILQQG